MARLPRVYVENAVYYITCRAAQREKLFNEKKDYYMYKELLEKYRQEYMFKLFAYVLLPQHLHLLLEPHPDFEISGIMRGLNTSYSKYFNNAYNRRGHLFRERFRAAIIEKAAYLAPVSVYTHLNPVRASLVLSAFDYPYSSLSSYLRQPVSEEAAEVLALIPDLSYKEYIGSRGTGSAEYELLHKKLQRGGILGTKKFIKEVRAKISEKKEQVKKEETPALQRAVRKVSLLVLVLLLCASGLLYLFGRRHPLKKAAREPAKAAEPISYYVSATPFLQNTEWEVKVYPSDGSKPYGDTLSFMNGKFVSGIFGQKGFRPTNYSRASEGNKIIWETVQNNKGAIISWRGEIENNSMRGVASLVSNGVTQTFSFTSLRWRRK